MIDEYVGMGSLGDGLLGLVLRDVEVEFDEGLVQDEGLGDMGFITVPVGQPAAAQPNMEYFVGTCLHMPRDLL
jgi:hypothetical protein